MSGRDIQLVISGLGGQGVVFLSRVLAEAAMLEGRELLTAETHGMAQRGAAVDSHVKIGGYESSVVRRGSADVVLVLDPNRLPSARRMLSPDGSGFLDAARPVDGVHACDASGAAIEMGFLRGANLVLLGFAGRVREDLFPARAAILDALERVSPPRVRESNHRAFERGAAVRP